MKTQTLFQNCRVVSNPDDVIAFGRTHGWFFQKMEEKGVLESEILKSDWVYQQDSNTFPVTDQKKEAYRRLDAVREAGYPIKQVIYGYQIKEEKSKTEPKSETKPLPQIKLSDNTADILAKVVLGTLALTVGAALVMGYAMIMALYAVDPCLIVVLDTGEDEKECPWICLSSWEE